MPRSYVYAGWQGGWKNDYPVSDPDSLCVSMEVEATLGFFMVNELCTLPGSVTCKAGI